MSKEVKKYRAKAYADLSLQFYKDRTGRGHFLVTKNACERLFNPIDDLVFADQFADIKELTKDEILKLCNIFVKVKKIIEDRNE